MYSVLFGEIYVETLDITKYNSICVRILYKICIYIYRLYVICCIPNCISGGWVPENQNTNNIYFNYCVYIHESKKEQRYILQCHQKRSQIIELVSSKNIIIII